MSPDVDGLGLPDRLDDHDVDHIPGIEEYVLNSQDFERVIAAAVAPIGKQR